MDIHDLRNKLKGYLNSSNGNYGKYCNIIDEELSLEDLNNSINFMYELNHNGRLHEISEIKNNNDGFSIMTKAGMHFFR